MITTTTLNPSAKLDGLFGHLSAYGGLYSRETFVNLYSCLVRIIRQYQLKGVVFQRFLGDSDFESVSLALEQLPGLSVYQIQSSPATTEHHAGGSRSNLGDPQWMIPETGFVLVLTNQLCAAVHWSTQTEAEFKMLDGGWTFNPKDSRTIALKIAEHLGDFPDLIDQIEATPLDRRYDEKMTWFVTQLVNNLETRNRELSIALNQLQQLHSKWVDQERLAAIGQLCSVIAHEIRNPLGLIDLYAKLMESELGKLTPALPANLTGPDSSGEKLEKHLNLIRSATQSLESILSELTQYARPLTLETTMLDIRLLVQDVVDMYHPKCQESHIGLQLDLPPEAIMAEIDTRRIKQALINLVKNALEASKAQGQIRVSVNIRKDDDCIYVKVSDQGAGIDEKVREKLFTPYFSTKGNGTGLGLAHTQKILQAHKGSVCLLQSVPGQGSTFALVLPRPTQQHPHSSARSATTQGVLESNGQPLPYSV